MTTTLSCRTKTRQWPESKIRGYFNELQNSKLTWNLQDNIQPRHRLRTRMWPPCKLHTKTAQQVSNRMKRSRVKTFNNNQPIIGSLHFKTLQQAPLCEHIENSWTRQNNVQNTNTAHSWWWPQAHQQRVTTYAAPTKQTVGTVHSSLYMTTYK